MSDVLPQLTPLPRPKGRRVPPLPEFTFPTSGETVRIRRLGPFTMDEIGKAVRKEQGPPQPPKVKVEVGEDRIKLEEANPADPEYIRAVQEYNVWFQQECARRLITLMINYCVVTEIDLEVVAERREMLLLIGHSEEEVAALSDREVFVRHYLVQSTDDLAQLQTFILSQSQPTPEVVQQHVDSFQGDVQG